MDDQKNKIGLWTSTSLVVGNMIGAGIFLMPATLATYGSISLLGWVFSSLGAFVLAKIFANLSKYMPVADGGPYAYSQKGLGDFAGFLVAWGYWISVWTANAAITVSLISALSTFFPVLATNPVAAAITGLAAIWILTWINNLGIVISGKIQLITTIGKILPLMTVAIAGLFYIKFENFQPFNSTGTSTWSAITATTTLTFYSYLGIECATIPSSSVSNPEKTISRATLLGTGIAALIYILSSISAMGMMPAETLKNSVTPFADAAAMIWGNGARYWVSAGVAIAAFGALNGWILIQGQVPYAIGKDKLFPAIFTRVNKRNVPVMGVAISSALISILTLMNYTKGLVEQFKFLILLATMTVLLPYLFSSVAYVLIRSDFSKAKKGGWISAITLSTLGFIFSLWAIGGSGMETVYWGFILLLCGIPLYVWTLWDKKREVTNKDSNRPTMPE
jgi:APA family basic amino acid/polyamine antiporter